MIGIKIGIVKNFIDELAKHRLRYTLLHFGEHLCSYGQYMEWLKGALK